MTVTYGAATKNRRMQVVRDDIDAGSGPGKLQIYNAAFALLLAEIELDDPATSVTFDVLTLLGTPIEDVGIADGTAARCRIRDSDDNIVVDMTVGISGSGADVIIDSVTVSIGQTVRVRSGSITHG